MHTSKASPAARPAVLLWFLGLLAGPVQADVVTQRWGVAGHVQHPGTLRYEVLGSGGTGMRFDLSALPKRAKVYRARLVLARADGDHSRSFDIVPVQQLTEDGSVKLAGKPLELCPPYYRWFDATEVVRKWASAGQAEGLLLIRGGPRFQRESAFLEVSYEGKLAEPPPQVSGLRAFCRGGQVFLTFTEVEDLSEGQDRYAWGDLIKKLKGYSADGPIPKDEKRELRYHLYRSDRPITAKNIGQAELLAEVVPGSGFNTRIVQRIWQGENRPSKLDDSFIAVRLGVEAGKPLPSGVGVYVHTLRRSGRGYYAVLTAVNGVENTVELSAANTAGPIEERVAEPEPVLQEEKIEKGRSPKEELVTRRYCYWAMPPLSPRPLQYGFVIQYHPQLVGKPAPLELNHGKAHTNEPELSRWQRADAILLAGSADPEIGFYVGVNDCLGTLKSFRQGTWGPWTYNRHAKLIEWARRNYDVDEQQIYCYGSHWGMWELRHPEIFSAFIGWGSAELTKGFVDWNRCNGVWGPPEAYQGRPDAENPYVTCNFTEYVAADPARELPYQMLIPCTGSHTSEMSYPALPRYKRALMSAGQPFAADIGKVSWSFATPAVLREFRAGKLKVLRDQSKPAFANCTLDDNPGCGDIRNGDGTGLLNGYLLWETERIVDEPGRWEMTVLLDGSAPLDSCKVDLTPRHCQKFKLKPGQKLTWTNTSLADEKIIEKGQAEADKHGLVRLEQITVLKTKNRIAISAAR